MARLTLKPGYWYAWQMMPGYTEVPYYSPIRVAHCEGLRTGASKLRLVFFNAAYAEGVQDSEVTLRVLVRDRDYLVGVREDGNDTGEIRTAIISRITWNWMKLHFRDLVDANLSRRPEWPGSSLFGFLDETYLG